MDLGVPEASLGCNCVAFFSISTVLAISSKQTTMNVRGSTGRQAFCSFLEGFTSGDGFLGFPGLFCRHWAFPMVFVVVVVVLVEFERWSGPVNGFGCTRGISGGQLYCFCLYCNSSGNIV